MTRSSYRAWCGVIGRVLPKPAALMREALSETLPVRIATGEIRAYLPVSSDEGMAAGSGTSLLVWAAGCELSLALVHARQPAWPGETSEKIIRVALPRKMRPPDHTQVNWPVDASASGSAQVGPSGHHRWAARVQVDREPARQQAREGYPSHYTSLSRLNLNPIHGSVNGHQGGT